MSIEQKVNRFLQKTPVIKKVMKRTYQLVMYAVSPKIKAEGNIRRLSPDDDYEYFFGYYDKSPWDADEQNVLCLRVKETTNSVAPKDIAEIILIDTETLQTEKLGETRTWNVQQGSMLQWLGPDFKNRILYNDFRDGEYCSVIYDRNTKKEKVIKKPVYSVSSDGKTALTLDFSRLHRLRPGYGYSNKQEGAATEKCPDKTAIWKVDLEENEVTPLLKYTDFYNFEHREEMKEAEHKVNHIMINPSGHRFMVMHRWVQGSRRFTRLLTVNLDGNDLYNLSDDDMVSHCYWKNNNEILGYAHKKELGNGYYLMQDKSNEFKQLWPSLDSDGHPSYSPDGTRIVTDTYPNRSRMQKLFILKENEDAVEQVAQVFSPFKYDNDFRCDLHPRWNRNSNKISIDAVFEGKRRLYEVKIGEENLE